MVVGRLVVVNSPWLAPVEVAANRVEVARVGEKAVGVAMAVAV